MKQNKMEQQYERAQKSWARTGAAEVEIMGCCSDITHEDKWVCLPSRNNFLRKEIRLKLML
jgi:hypothetical protein